MWEGGLAHKPDTQQLLGFVISWTVPLLESSGDVPRKPHVPSCKTQGSHSIDRNTHEPFQAGSWVPPIHKMHSSSWVRNGAREMAQLAKELVASLPTWLRSLETIWRRRRTSTSGPLTSTCTPRHVLHSAHPQHTRMNEVELSSLCLSNRCEEIPLHSWLFSKTSLRKSQLF